MKSVYHEIVLAELEKEDLPWEELAKVLINEQYPGIRRLYDCRHEASLEDIGDASE